MNNYCNEAQVASALGLNPNTTLSAQANVGDTTIQVAGSVFFPGQRLALDHFQDDTLGEVVLVKSVNGNTLTLQNPLVNQHVQGAPVVEVTAITKTLASASRMIDGLTYYENVGFDQEAKTENLIGIVQNDGSILISAKKPIVQSVTSLTIQNTIMDPTVNIPVSQLDINGYFVTAFTQNTNFVPSVSSREVRASLNYVGGYNPLPDAIVRSAIVFAARFFKEKDSGFADVIGNADLGIMQYKKGVPAEVAALLKPYIRYTP